ncbi:MAG: TIGR00289 family protein [Euryarchaeota archaeon]|nr:TIGR00289 family protein [Euryarchaeota archaeon]
MKMKVAALFSGGKDSVFAVYVAKQYGWDVSNLVSLFSDNKESWMFHSINIHLVPLLAQALDTPLVQCVTKGEKEQELNDLKKILSSLDVDGVISGAVSSEYQRTRIERICYELGMKSFTPLWHKNPEVLLRNQINAGFNIKMVGVFAQGFDESWLGRTLDIQTLKELVMLQKRYKINIVGEGGEYETLVVDGPMFSKTLVLDAVVREWSRDNGVLQVKNAHLEKKDQSIR